MSVEKLSLSSVKTTLDTLINKPRTDLPESWIKPDGEIVRPIVHGRTVEVKTSIDNALNHPVFKWMKTDQESFKAAATRNPQIKYGVLAIDELLKTIDKYGEDCPPLLLSALTELIVELALEAEPFIPNIIIENSLPSQQLDENQGNGRYIPTDRKDGSTHPQSIKNEAADGIRKWQERLLQILSDQRCTPMLNGIQKVGNDVWDKGYRGKNKEFIHSTYQDAFIITRIANVYDPTNETLSTKADRIKLRLPKYDTTSTDGIIVELGRVDLSEVSEISIPQPIKVVKNRRIQPYDRLGILHMVSIINGKEDLTSELLEPFLYRDSLGNIILSVSEMPDELRRRLQGDKVYMIAKFCQQKIFPPQSLKDYDLRKERFNKDCNSELHIKPETKQHVPLIGKMPEDEYYRLQLYPPEVERFVRRLKMMMTEERKGKKRITKHEALSKLTQFIGSWWLTYSKEKNIRSDDDPSGFQQTERVLANQSATCEGANIVLGQLMRYFLDEDEDILYVMGFGLQSQGKEGSTSGTKENYHLQVLYRSRDKNNYFFDATPWVRDQHETFKEKGKQYKQAKREWLAIEKKFPSPEDDEQKSQDDRAEELELRLRSGWTGNESDDKEFFERLDLETNTSTQQLPGYCDYEMVYLVKVSHAEAREYVQLMNNRSRGQKQKNTRDRYDQPPVMDEYYSQNLVQFLKALHQVRPEHAQYWSTPYDIVSGDIKFILRYLTIPFYEIGMNSYNKEYNSGFHPEWYTHELGKEEILGDPVFRKQLYDKMRQVKADARRASEQNLRAGNILVDKLTMLSNEYKDRLKSIFKPYSHLISGGVDDFIQASHVMYLLNNPMHYLRGSFMRGAKHNRLGFLSPGDDEGIENLLGEKLIDWKNEVEKQLVEISRLLIEAPAKRSAERKSVKVPSIIFWKGLEDPHPTKTETSITEEKFYFDPFEIFVYLHKGLNKNPNLKY